VDLWRLLRPDLLTVDRDHRADRLDVAIALLHDHEVLTPDLLGRALAIQGHDEGCGPRLPTVGRADRQGLVGAALATAEQFAPSPGERSAGEAVTSSQVAPTTSGLPIIVMPWAAGAGCGVGTGASAGSVITTGTDGVAGSIRAGRGGSVEQLARVCLTKHGILF